MARGLREHGFFRLSWFMKKRTMEFFLFFALSGPAPIFALYMYKNWEGNGLNKLWYSTLNNKFDDDYRMRLLTGLDDPDSLRARLNKLQAPEEYASHLPAEDHVAVNTAFRNTKWDRSI